MLKLLANNDLYVIKKKLGTLFYKTAGLHPLIEEITVRYSKAFILSTRLLSYFINRLPVIPDDLNVSTVIRKLLSATIDGKAITLCDVKCDPGSLFKIEKKYPHQVHDKNYRSSRQSHRGEFSQRYSDEF